MTPFIKRYPLQLISYQDIWFRLSKFSKKFEPSLTIQTICRLNFHKVECTHPPRVTSCHIFINTFSTYKWLKKATQNEFFHSFHWLLAKKTGIMTDKGKSFVIICFYYVCDLYTQKNFLYRQDVVYGCTYVQLHSILVILVQGWTV